MALGLDGRYLVTGGTDGIAHVVDTALGAEVSHLAHQASVDTVAISADGRYVATGSDDHTARVFEAASGRSISLLAHVDKVWAVSFSADSRYVATGGFDGTIRIFETTKRREVIRLPRPDAGEGSIGAGKISSPVVLVALSPDGQYVVSAFWGGTVEAFDVASGNRIWSHSQDRVSRSTFDWRRSELTFPFMGEDTILSLSFSPAGRYVAIGSLDNTARVYETVTGREVWRLNNEDPVLAVNFVKQGKFLQTAVESSNVLNIADNPLRPDDLIADVCSRVTHNLTRDQWKLYVGTGGYRKTCPNLPEPPSGNR